MYLTASRMAANSDAVDVVLCPISKLEELLWAGITIPAPARSSEKDPSVYTCVVEPYVSLMTLNASCFSTGSGVDDFL